MAAEERVGRRAAAEAAILDATSALLEEGGSWAALSVEQIANRAGIGRTAFYFYFRDKAELLIRLTGEAAAALYEENARWWRDGAELGDALERSTAAYLEHQTVLRVVSEAAAYDDEIREFWVALVDRFVDATRQRIEADKLAGLAADVPAAETAMALVWMCERTLYQFCRETPDADPAAVTDALVQIARRAIYGRLPD